MKQKIDYWALIEAIGWGKKTVDYDAIAREYYKKLGKAGMNKFDRFVGDRVNDLQNAVKKYEEEHGQLDVGSDDGFSDVTYHIVGMGWLEWSKAMANPKLVEVRYNAKYKTFAGYTESFAYCFLEPELNPPSPSDELAGLRKQLLSTNAEIQRLEEVRNGLNTKILALEAKVVEKSA